MSDKKVTVSLPIGGLLGLLFVGLKLTGYIDWSWWWVTAPFWAPFAIMACFFGFFLGIAALGAVASFLLNVMRSR